MNQKEPLGKKHTQKFSFKNYDKKILLLTFQKKDEFLPLKWALQLSNAVTYLHGRKIIHSKQHFHLFYVFF